MVIEAEPNDNLIKLLRILANQLNIFLSDGYLESIIFAATFAYLNIFHISYIFYHIFIRQINLSLWFPDSVILSSTSYHTALQLHHNISQQRLSTTNQYLGKQTWSESIGE